MYSGTFKILDLAHDMKIQGNPLKTYNRYHIVNVHAKFVVKLQKVILGTSPVSTNKISPIFVMCAIKTTSRGRDVVDIRPKFPRLEKKNDPY